MTTTRRRREKAKRRRRPSGRRSSASRTRPRESRCASATCTTARPTSLDTADEFAAAQAAAEYVNEYLGGIAGRPIELHECTTDQTPSGAAGCVNEMVTAGVPVALNGVSGQGPSLYAPMAEAGVPMFVTGSLDQESFTTPGIAIMTNGIVAALAGPAQIAADDGIDRAAVVVIDVPAASGPVEQAASIFYGNADVEVDVVKVAPDAADLTPDIQAELSNDPGQFAVVGDPTFCTKAMNALASVGFTGNIVIIPQCIDDAFLESVTNLEGVTVLTSFAASETSEEHQIYNAVMDTYAGDDVDRGSTAPNGYQAVVGFARAMSGLTGEVTPDSVQATLAAMPPTPMPLADGVMFQCDGEQVEIAPNLCSTDALVTTLDADGKPTEYEVLNGAELLTLG